MIREACNDQTRSFTLCNSIDTSVDVRDELEGDDVNASGGDVDAVQGNG